MRVITISLPKNIRQKVKKHIEYIESYLEAKHKMSNERLTETEIRQILLNMINE